jgi:DNA-binding protein YbaB
MSIPDLKGLLETAQRIQSEVARVREELARKTVVGETGGGL